MKSQKRDPGLRAYKKGYQAGLSGKSNTACPSKHEPERQQWMVGWREGHQDNLDGLTGVSGVPKVIEMSH